MRKHQTRLALLTTAVLMIHQQSYAQLPNTMVALDEQQLANQTGQALFNLSYIAPTDASNLMRDKTINGNPIGNIGFYKLGIEADVELNANIRNLQLGCGGINGVNECDIDIKNLSLSGLPNNFDSATGTINTNEGNPDFGSTNQRAATSAKLNNPFIEFAINNPNDAALREIRGFRISAEKISALLTAGLDNLSIPSSTDGIQSLSGFMRIAPTTGSVDTKQTLFGNTSDQVLTGVKKDAQGNLLTDDQAPMMIVSLLGTHKRIINSTPGNPENLGITIPSLKNIAFNTPGFRVNGNRNSAAVVNGIKLKVNEIPMGVVSDGFDANGNQKFTKVGANNQLFVTYNPILGLAKSAKFQMADGSKVTNLNMDVTFSQALSMFHNIPLNGTGMYLSFQKDATLWPGAYIKTIADKDYATDSYSELNQTDLVKMTQSDVAQRGWWMSFSDPVRLGTLKASSPVDISATLPQVAYLSSLFLQDNPIPVSGGEGLGSLFGTPVNKLLNIDLDTYTKNNPVKTILQNLKLVNQVVTPNCWGGVKFC